MARIRTIKPDFWEDDGTAALSRDARLLFIASWNFADDEGRLRWTALYLKASAFMYDDDLGLADVERLMIELEQGAFVVAYRGGRTNQQLAYIPNFRKHQRINKPQPAKFPEPPTEAVNDSRNDSGNDSRNDSGTNSGWEGKGKEGKGRGREGRRVHGTDHERIDRPSQAAPPQRWA